LQEKVENMMRYSSNATLMLVIFLPVFFWVLSGLITLGVFLGPLMDEQVYFSGLGKVIAVLFLIVVTLINVFFALKFRRLEADSEKIYISNYFKHSLMTVENIRNVIIVDLFIMRIVTIQFNQQSIWGYKIKILERENMFEKYCIEQSIPYVKKP